MEACEAAPSYNDVYTYDGEDVGVVNSFNEWDPLEEVIVGRVEGAAESAFEPGLLPYYPECDAKRMALGRAWPQEQKAAAAEQLEGLVRLLRGEGIRVHRPLASAYDRQATATPDWSSPLGHCCACPRDVLLVVGDEIIEAPMAWRSRFFEYRAYRPLIHRYFERGARWTAAPKPLLADALYDQSWVANSAPFHITGNALLRESEPVWDAACYTRCGRDIFWQPDIVSNAFGFRWLQRHLGSKYRLHQVSFSSDVLVPQHIDTTLVPLRPGIAMTNPDAPADLKTTQLFRSNGWRMFDAPRSVMESLPPEAVEVICEAKEIPTIRFLEDLGFKVLPLPFDQVFRFGGSFHCCTSDIRRRGDLQSYFPALDAAEAEAIEGKDVDV